MPNACAIALPTSNDAPTSGVLVYSDATFWLVL